jgi:hypothetical protein
MTNALPIPAGISAARLAIAVRGLTKAWCRLMHASVTWPVGGHYACRTCGRQYPVPWRGSQ